MVALLDSLPPELYSDILSYVPREDLQQVVLALTRAIPHSPVPTKHLFEHVRLKHQDQPFQLYRRLHKDPETAACVQHFSLEVWTVDADVVVNLIALLSQVEELSLFIGHTFAPEHLEEMFQEPIEGLKFLSLRFRPYVQKATYYQFLKGAYFDSTIEAFSRWPEADLPTISIVQDPLDSSVAPTKFAQPLVFFQLDPLSSLARSPLFENVLNFRLRVPARQTARYLYASPQSLPNVERLDLSTSSVPENDVEGMLGRFGRLKTLMLDGCYLVNQRPGVQQHDPDALGQWSAFGKMMAFAGVRYARERERKIKAWREACYMHAKRREQQEQPVGEEQAAERPAHGRRTRGGRRGLAVSTISLRDSPPTTAPLPAAGSSSARPDDLPPEGQRIRILPSAPTIRSLATTPPASVGPDKYDAIRAKFEHGWAEGIAQLSAVRSRMRASWKNGVRILMIDDEYMPGEGESGEEGLAGLKDIQGERDFALRVAGDEWAEEGEDADLDEGRCPILCLAGPGRKGDHVPGCGHEEGWGVWKDEL